MQFLSRLLKNCNHLTIASLDDDKVGFNVVFRPVYVCMYDAVHIQKPDKTTTTFLVICERKTKNRVKELNEHKNKTIYPPAVFIEKFDI